MDRRDPGDRRRSTHRAAGAGMGPAAGWRPLAPRERSGDRGEVAASVLVVVSVIAVGLLVGLILHLQS